MIVVLAALASNASRWPTDGQAGRAWVSPGCDPDTDPPIIVYPSQDIAVQLDPCDGSRTAVVFFDATATDACDPFPSLSIDVAASPGGSLQLSNPFQNTYLALATPGTYQLTLSATDASGNSREEDFFIQVNQAPAPAADYSCNDTVNINLGPGCQRYVSADMLLEGEAGCLRDADFRIEIQDAMPANGNILDEIGFYPYSIERIQPAAVSGFAGPFALSHWSTHVDLQGSVAANGAADSLILNGSTVAAAAIAVLPIHFDGNLSFNWGAAALPAGAAFEGSLQGPAGNVIASFSSAAGAGGAQNLAVSAGSRLVLWLLSADQSGTALLPRAWLSGWSFSYAPANIGGTLSCWGTINARDGAPPALDCPVEADMALLPTQVQFLAGELDSSDPLLNTALYSCMIGNFSASGDRYYEVISFEVSQTDIYTFILDSDFDTGDADMALFQGSFDANNPCGNIIAQVNFPQPPNPVGGFGGPFVRIALPMRPGQQYFLLTSSDTPGATGPYQYVVMSDSTGQLLGVPDSVLSIAYPLYCEDVELIQGNAGSPAWTGAPVAEGNCTAVSVTFSDALTSMGDCGGLFLTRTFLALDEAGNSAACDQRINFRRPTIDDVSLPPLTAPIECDEAFPVDEFGNPSPDFTGYPFLLTATGIVDLRDAYCNIGASYQDGPLIDICLLSYKFIRTWTIVDWCNPGSTLLYPQIIKIGDFTAPQVSCPIVDLDGDGFPDPLVYSTGPFECTAAFMAPRPVVSDNCSLWEVTTEIVTDDSTIIYGPSGNPVDTVWETVVLATIPPNAPNRLVSGIPVGCHRFRYKVKDECGNQAIKECGFCVEDRINPAASCDDQLHVSIGPGGVGRLFATAFDEGSWDNCGIERLEVRREARLDGSCSPVAPFFTPWGEYVDFFCCEANSTLRVELQVFDAAGNKNVCWANIPVEDKARPSCTPPPPVSINCDALPANFEPLDAALLQGLFGAPLAADNCGASWNELPPVDGRDNCGFGTLIRQFQAVDDFGNISAGACQQAITIQEQHNYEIRFPADAEANCGYPNADTIGVSEIGCDLLAVTVDDVFLSASGDECYKIFRTYRVINWCEYDGDGSPIQVGRDEDCDGAPGDEEVWVLRRPGHAYIDRDNDELNANPLAGERGDACPPGNPQGYWRNSPSTGYWQYIQHLKVYDTIPPQIQYVIPLAFCAISDDCLAGVEYLFIIADNCTPDDLEFEVYYDEDADGVLDSMITDIFGIYPKWKISGEFPIGRHCFRVTVRDGCGNTASECLPFEVVDCKAPSPNCINGLVSTLMPVPPDTDADGDGDIDRGALTVFASDFLASPVSDCSGPVTFSINRPGELPSPDKPGLVITCDDLGALLVEIYAWDAAGNPHAIQPDSTVGGPNYDYCETFILVQDNGGNCVLSQGMIAGLVQREGQEPVAEVSVALSGDDTGTIYTADDGLYAFTNLELNYDYTITPFRDGDDQNGLSTYDIVLISQHILGTRPLDSPYKMIAADVNNSGSISTIDIIQLRQLVLSIILEFPANTSWRFVPRAYSFPNPQDPWAVPFPEAIQVNGLNSPRLTEDFVAIKVGDVDLSAQANGLQGVEGRSYGTWLSLDCTDKYLQAGEEHTLTLQAELFGLLGLQAALHFDAGALSVEGIKGAAIPDQCFNQDHLDQGRLLLSWNTGVPYPAEAVLASVHLRARKAGWLSEALRLDEGLLAAEAYGQHYRKIGLALEWGSRSFAGALFPNYPNPFTQETIIPFELAEAGLARIELFSRDGTVVKTVKGFYSVGRHELVIQAADLPGPGVYFYRLQAGKQAWVQKMVFSGKG